MQVELKTSYKLLCLVRYVVTWIDNKASKLAVRYIILRYLCKSDESWE